MIRCLIIDPDPLSRKQLSRLLARYEEFSIVGMYSHPDELPYVADKSEADVLFIDVEFQRINGLDYIRSLDNAPLTVITTMYRAYAVECFELDILDYLIKPIEPARMSKTIARIKRSLKEKPHITISSEEASDTSAQDYVFIRADKKRIKIPYAHILYVESIKDYICIHTTTQEYVIHQTLSGFTTSLPSDQFIRIHRSYTVNMRHIDAMTGSNVSLAGRQLPIGRNYMSAVREKILR